MGKKHPLDIFRSSADGFDTASRERRTVVGRVVASAPRAVPGDAEPARATAPEAALTGLPPAVAAMRRSVQAAPAVTPAPAVARNPGGLERVVLPPGARPLHPPRAPVAAQAQAALAAEWPAPFAVRPAAPARQAPAPRAAASHPEAVPPRMLRLPASVNRALMLSACVLVGGLALWTLAASLGGGPALKSAAPGPAPAGAQVFRVQAAAYPGTLAGQASAFNARDLLRQQGFPDVDVVAWPGSQPDTFARFDLVVGRGGSEAALAEVLKSLKGLRNWPGAQKSPFKDALVVGWPTR